MQKVDTERQVTLIEQPLVEAPKSYEPDSRALAARAKQLMREIGYNVEKDALGRLYDVRKLDMYKPYLAEARKQLIEEDGAEQGGEA